MRGKIGVGVREEIFRLKSQECRKLIWFHALRPFWRARASSLLSDACSSSWTASLNAVLDQSMPVSCRAESFSDDR